jgi:hypothetical protein
MTALSMSPDQTCPIVVRPVGSVSYALMATLTRTLWLSCLRSATAWSSAVWDSVLRFVLPRRMRAIPMASLGR